MVRSSAIRTTRSGAADMSFASGSPTADIFFHWGGKRKVRASDPLELSQAAGVEQELFTLCAEVSSRSWSRGHHSVYAIELDRDVCEESHLP